MDNNDYLEDDLPGKLSMAVEYFNTVLYNNIPLIAQTLYSCIYTKNKVIVCATGENIQPSLSFVQDLNLLSVPDTGSVAAVSMNSDVRLIQVLQRAANNRIYTGQFESIVKDMDALMVIPSNTSDVALLAALEDLIKRAKDQNTMVIMLSCKQDGDQLSRHLVPGEDIYLELGDGTDYTSNIHVLITLQSILNKFKELKNS